MITSLVRCNFLRDFTRDFIPLKGLTATLSLLFPDQPLNVSTGGAATGGSARGVMVDKQLSSVTPFDDNNPPEVIRILRSTCCVH